MKVKMQNVYKGFTFICTSKNEKQICSTLHEKHVFMIKIAEDIYVKLDDLIKNPGRFKDIISRLPRYTTRPSRAGEIYVDNHCISRVFEDCYENEKIDVKDIVEASKISEIQSYTK